MAAKNSRGLLLLLPLTACLLLAGFAADRLAWCPGIRGTPGAAGHAAHHRSLSPASSPTSATSPPASSARELVNNHGQRKREGSEGTVEAGLAEARASIRRATLTRRNRTSVHRRGGRVFVPRDAVYRNARAFHQSYIEMEKTFKVWAYREGEPPVVQHGDGDGTGGARAHGIEGHLIAEMEGSGGRYRARHPGEAHAFFLPISVATIAGYIHRRDVIDYWAPQLRLVAGYVDALAAKYPYWNRSRGADHFFVSCHDWAPVLSAATAELRANAIRVICNADASEGFDPATDVALPEVNDVIRDGRAGAIAGAGRRASERTVLAFFAGGTRSGVVRDALLAEWEGKDDRMLVYGERVPPVPAGLDGGEVMRSARFCLCPGGREASASPGRVVEAIAAGCVPVIIISGAGNYDSLPFGDVLDWRRFSVAVPADRIPAIKDILLAISDRRYAALRGRVLRVWRHFRLNRPAKRFDAVNMAIHSIWLRRLNCGSPADKLNSATRHETHTHTHACTDASAPDSLTCMAKLACVHVLYMHVHATVKLSMCQCKCVSSTTGSCSTTLHSGSASTYSDLLMQCLQEV